MCEHPPSELSIVEIALQHKTFIVLCNSKYKDALIGMISVVSNGNFVHFGEIFVIAQ